MELLVTYPHSGQNGARGANVDRILAPLCRQITLPHRPIEDLRRYPRCMMKLAVADHGNIASDNDATDGGGRA